MGNDALRRISTAAGLALLLAGCAGGNPWPFNSRQAVFRAPEPPAVLGRTDLPRCPPPMIAQAQWLARNMARVRLGTNKLQVVGILGDPANAETFSLTNGAAVEVLFYHTPETICRVSSRGEGLMPLVFQDDRLLGYGQNYYKQFIVPMMRQAVVNNAGDGPVAAADAMPQGRVQMTPAQALAPAPARTGRLVQEDLPAQRGAYGATPPASIYAPTPVPPYGNGYSTPMQYDSRTGLQPAGYYDSGVPLNAVGRGAPLQ